MYTSVARERVAKRLPGAKLVAQQAGPDSDSSAHLVAGGAMGTMYRRNTTLVTSHQRNFSRCWRVACLRRPLRALPPMNRHVCLQTVRRTSFPILQVSLAGVARRFDPTCPRNSPWKTHATRTCDTARPCSPTRTLSLWIARFAFRAFALL